MLEELRRDLSNARHKVDREINELVVKPTDTGAVISIIEEASNRLDCERK